MSKLFWSGVTVLVIGGLLVFAGFQEKSLADVASAAPEEISLAALIARGPDGNPNLIITDFVLCENYVFQTKNGIWQTAWVPAVPVQADNQAGGGRPPVVHALIMTTHAKSQAQLYQRCGQARLGVLMTNRINSLSGDVRNLLTQSYPGTDFSRCLILQEGREVAGHSKLVLLLGSGIILVLVALVLLGGAAYLWQKERSAPSGKRRPAVDDEEDEDEDDRPAPRRRDRDDHDEDRPRKRSRPVDDAEEGEGRPRRRTSDDEDYRPRRRRPATREDD
jgi:hypothetical protein